MGELIQSRDLISQSQLLFTSLIVGIDFLDSFTAMFGWIDCSPPTGIRLWTMVTLWSQGLFCCFALSIWPPSRIARIVRTFLSFLFLITWHVPLSIQIRWFSLLALVHCNELLILSLKKLKINCSQLFPVPGLSFKNEAINRQINHQNLLTRGSLGKVNFFLIWHDVKKIQFSPAAAITISQVRSTS